MIRERERPHRTWIKIYQLSLTVVLLLGVGSTYFTYNNNFSKNNNQSHGFARMAFILEWEQNCPNRTQW